MKVGLIYRMSEGMKRGIRSWLNIRDADPAMILINETLDYEANAIKNRIWYRGDSNELQQLYSQIHTGIDRYKFWAGKSSPGQEMRKIHTGLPALVVDTLAGISLTDFKIQIEKNSTDLELWKAIEEDNKFRKKLDKAVKETLYIGDGAFKISFDTAISQYPIIEFYPGDRIELVTERGRIREIVFKTVYQHEHAQYVLYEHYGYGYITYELYKENNMVDLYAIPQTANLVDVAFGSVDPGEKYMMAVPIQFYESGKWDERGQSVFDKKIDSFDAFDEAWSQWMDALRKSRAKIYMPEDLIPKDKNGGALLNPNFFDDSFIKISGGFSENEGGAINIVQPNIPHDSYLASYVTALDLCLQGLISPSTLGIDMKKLDNAEAQREKEKATLYTRDTIINALQVDIPLLVETAVKAYNEFCNKPVKPVQVTVEFGDYANPSFESQIETISKARTGQIMSVDAAVDELYGDDKDEKWKQEEVRRIKSELGIAEEEEPGMKLELDGSKIGGAGDEGKSGSDNISDDPEGVPRAVGNSQGTDPFGRVRSGKS